MILALFIGRLGCFAMGIYEDTYGVETTFFTVMNLGDGLLRHPVTLYEIAFLLILWIGLIQLGKKCPLLTEGGLRFFAECRSFVTDRFCSLQFI
jgi:phosphatidylglycerol:prolipoprotein diacylglycerol transferase